MVRYEIREEIRSHYLLYVGDAGPFNVLEYAKNILDNWIKMGYTEDIVNLFEKYGVKQLNDVPMEKYVDFLEEVLNFNPKKTED